MQNGSSSDVDVPTSVSNGPETLANGLAPEQPAADDAPLQDASHPPQSNHATNASTAERGRKRKHSETLTPQRPKKSSPPWKKFGVDGVTTFTEDGRRKSSRTNTIPLDLQPHSAKRTTRGEYGRHRGRKARIGGAQRDNGPAAPQSPSSSRSKTLQKRGTSVAGRAAGPRRQSSRVSHAQTHQTALESSAVARRPGPQRRYQPSAPSDAQESHTSMSGRRSRSSQNHVGSQQSDVGTDEASWKPRIRLRMGPQELPLVNPASFPAPKKFGSLEELLAQDDPLEGDELPRLTPIQVEEEAQARWRMVEAAKPGGPLSAAVFHESEEEVLDEPFAGYTTTDYMLRHAVDLQSRMLRESRDHRMLARKIAGIAAAAAKARMPKSAEELMRERQALSLEVFRKTCLRELRFMFETTTAKVWQVKRLEYEEREAAARRDRMKKMVDRSQGLLFARTGRRVPNLDDDNSSLLDLEMSDDSRTNGGEEDDDNTGVETSDDDSEGFDSDDSEESDEGTNDDDPDMELTQEQLLTKYKDVPDVAADSTGGHEETDAYDPAAEYLDHSEARERSGEIDESPGANDHDSFAQDGLHDELLEQHGAIDPSQHALEEVDDVLLEDSDEGSSDSGTPDEEDSGTDTSGEEDEGSSAGEDSDEAEEEDSGLLSGFLSKSERRRLELASAANEPESPQVLEADQAVQDTPGASGSTSEQVPGEATPTLMAEGTGDGRLAAQALPVMAPTSDEHSRQSTPHTVATSKPSRPESMSSVEPTGDKLSFLQDHAEADDAERVQVSSLIRGTLRPYQHAGFDWLARMYNESTNGILADEMGLGKTFQTIALLAHLATHHHVWGPHLIVVPTSVMLNWELEFKKFCPGFKVLTYYGTQEERKQKRKGWMDKDKWHVCITSYQLALQDAQPLKRRDWHYLILDEAHNIKNFRSQRWQTLLSFKSEARLLLTGTPLQNNLSELWSLLFFLAPEHDEDGNTGFGSLQEFSKVFHKPVDQILEHGRGVLDDESIAIVNKLHKVLRPHLLRRLKADVEKQMPKKYEHVTVCRLSKRQRQLYDSYMGLAGTRESFASGNYMSIINCLMQLRKVCNHPDLFDTRQIVTSYAMPKSAIADYEIKDLLIRRRLIEQQDSTGGHRGTVVNLWAPNEYGSVTTKSQKLSPVADFDTLIRIQESSLPSNSNDYMTIQSSIDAVNSQLISGRINTLAKQRFIAQDRGQRRPLFDLGLLKIISEPYARRRASPVLMRPDKLEPAPMTAEPYLEPVLDQLKLSLPDRAESLRPLVQRFGCVTPAVTAPHMSRLALTDAGVKLVEDLNEPSAVDPYHESRVRLSIAFPDKSLIQYDCGKLQQLDKLLRRLQSGGHRALIFTQMTKVLDILEQFMNLHGHRYLRLDGATKIEQRQILTDRFNSDPRILCFILSSRSGGLGINLTGADTVIFYDLDWNPAMDKQCQDRCHRIGQTRDVHIYRFVSEGTIEANILRKSNQKRMLDDVVIQEGDFTTEYLDKMDLDEGDADASAALDRVLGGGSSNSRVLEQVEDKEDQQAARVAQKEDNQTDAADFDDRPAPVRGEPVRPDAVSKISTPSTPTPATPQTPASESIEPDRPDGMRAPAHGLKPADLTAEQKQQLYEQFAARGLQQDKPQLRWKQDEEGELITDEQGNPAELPGFDEYMLRLFAWEMRDVVYAPPKDTKKGKKSKKAGGWNQVRG